MSLQPTPTYVVPDQTARVAKAAFPKGTLCLQLYDHLGTTFQDQNFAELFPQRGQPAAAPFRLALVTILQCRRPFGSCGRRCRPRALRLEIPVVPGAGRPRVRLFGVIRISRTPPG